MFGLSWCRDRYRTELDHLAGIGEFDSTVLDKIRGSAGTRASKSTLYYLASLYLQNGDTRSAEDLLTKSDSASVQMKKFCQVLIYCRKNGLPVPPLDVEEINCLNYLERVVNPPAVSFAQVIKQHDGVLICGNAPVNNLVTCSDSWCRIYFNDYRKNPVISGAATIHVVTPSWKTTQDNPAEYLCITGNNIFYRRSKVWRRFLDIDAHQAIFTVPREVWAGLRVELDSSPSAGLLVLSYVADLVRCGVIPVNTRIMVAGFSADLSQVNHAYDRVPASARHNWAAERIVYRRLLDELTNHCPNLVVQQG